MEFPPRNRSDWWYRRSRESRFLHCLPQHGISKCLTATTTVILPASSNRQKSIAIASRELDTPRRVSSTNPSAMSTQQTPRSLVGAMATSVMGNPSAPSSASLQLTSVQPSAHTTMDPALWSRLPLEILSIIIENTADSKTLKSWRGATKDSTRLHRVATRTSYSTFTICEKDLLRAPKVIRRHSRYNSFGDDEASDCTPSRAKRPMRQLILELARCSYQKFALHVRRLHLQFYFASSDRQMHLVRSEDIIHTLDMILPKATALHEIDHHGVLYQEMLNGILEVRSLKVLRVRQSWNDTPCSCSEGKFPRPRGLRTLDWSRLFHLHALKNLLVSQLYSDEAVGLAKAVKKMGKLETLRVEISDRDIRAANALSHDNDDDYLSLTAFINALYRCDEGDASKALGFPSSLKALALVNSRCW